MTPQTREPFRLEIQFWGVRGSMPTAEPENLGFGGNTSCVEVRLPDGSVFIIDGGTGLRRLGLHLVREGASRFHFLLTHFHWDHIQGMPFFAPFFNPASHVTIHSSLSGPELRRVLAGQMTPPYFPIPFEVLTAKIDFVNVRREGIRYGNLLIRPFPLNHPQGATGYRLESEGAVVVHACDSEHGDRELDAVLREYAQDADILIYDAQYTPREYERYKGRGHSTWLEGVRLAAAANVKHLILFHHDPSHDDQFMASMVDEARTHFANTDAAKELWKVRV